LVKGQNGEIPSHELDDGFETVHCGSYPYAGKSELCDGRIDHSTRTKLLQHAFAHFIGSIVFCDFFSHEKYGIIPSHLFAHTLSDGIP
jgi:hypothetical protein